MKKIVVFLVLSLGLCSSKASLASAEEWSLALEKDDIKVYERPLENTDLMQYRTEIVLDDNIFSVSAVLDDIPAAVEWFPYCLSAKVIDELDDGRKIILNISDFPWPFQDRYAVFSSKETKDYSQKQIIIDFEAYERYNAKSIAELVASGDLVKVTFMRGQWALTMIDRNKTKVVYTICADAGGHVPLWLIKTFFEGTPYKTLKNLRKIVKKSKYQECQIPVQDIQGFRVF